jgi:quinol monooxygenase YgiN
MPPRVKVIALLTVRPGGAEELTNLLLGMAPLCRAETGSLRWDSWQDQTRYDRYVLDERYVDDAAVAAHRDTAHYKGYLRRIGDLADRTALVLGPVAVEPKARW